MPSVKRPPLIVSRVDAILAVSAGLRNPLQMTIWPSLTRSVSAASAARAVKDSNVISSVGFGTVWKWSKSQTDSNPRRSACLATATVRCHPLAASQPSYSPVHPCGQITPSLMGTKSTRWGGGRGWAGPRALRSREWAGPPAPSTPHNHLSSLRANADVADRDPGQGLQPLDVGACRPWQLEPAPAAGGIG